MDSTSQPAVTLSTILNCSYNKAFNYLAAPLNQKEWAIHFFQDIEEINGVYMATLPFGKIPLEIKSNNNTGNPRYLFRQ